MLRVGFQKRDAIVKSKYTTNITGKHIPCEVNDQTSKKTGEGKDTKEIKWSNSLPVLDYVHVDRNECEWSASSIGVFDVCCIGLYLNELYSELAYLHDGCICGILHWIVSKWIVFRIGLFAVWYIGLCLRGLYLWLAYLLCLAFDCIWVECIGSY